MLEDSDEKPSWQNETAKDPSGIVDEVPESHHSEAALARQEAQSVALGAMELPLPDNIEDQNVDTDASR